MHNHSAMLGLGFTSVGGFGLSLTAVDIWVRIGSGVAATAASLLWIAYTIHKWRKGQ